MKYIIKFGREVIAGVEFDNNRTAREWADSNFPDRHACSVVGVKK